MNNFDGLLEKISSCSKKKVAVAVAQDDAVLEAVQAAKERNIADAILVGDEDKIKEVAASINMSLDGYEIIDVVPQKKTNKSPYTKENIENFLKTISDDEEDKDGNKIKERYKSIQEEKPNSRKDGKPSKSNKKGFVAGMTYFKSCYEYDEKENKYKKK